MKTNKIYLYAIEGLDASGKETASKGVCKLLKDNIQDMNIILKSFPDYNTLTGARIKELLNKDRTEEENDEMEELFIQNRKYAIEDIRNMDLIHDKTIVICDRYYFSSLFYDTEINVDSSKDILNKLTEIEYREVCGCGITLPNIVFCLSLELPTILKRLSRRRFKDKNEGIDKQTMFYERYNKILSVITNPNNYDNSQCVVVDANTTPEIIQNFIYKNIINDLVKLQKENV